MVKSSYIHRIDDPFKGGYITRHYGTPGTHIHALQMEISKDCYMDDDQVREAVAIADSKVLVEVSGGITLERIDRLAEIGVDLISVGALTHSAAAADVSLLLET